MDKWLVVMYGIIQQFLYNIYFISMNLCMMCLSNHLMQVKGGHAHPPNFVYVFDKFLNTSSMYFALFKPKEQV